MSDLDKVIHQPVRLRIVAALAALDKKEQIDFKTLAKMHQLTDGNLGAHLVKLEEAGYIRVNKGFENRKPRTQVSLTASGRKAFAAHVKALKAILDGNLGSGKD